MMLTSKAQYAVMAMADIVVCGKGEPVRLSDISERQNISVNYLVQLFSKLKKGKLVQAQRGPGGGYGLSRDASTILIADVLAAVEEPIKITRCDNKKDHSCLGSSSRCLTHHLWEGLSEQITNYLKSVSLEDVCQKNGQKKTHNLDDFILERVQ